MTPRPAIQPPVGPLYLVICGNHIPQYTPERELRDMTWNGTVDDITSLQFETLARVVEIGTARDVTADMLRKVFDTWAAQGDPLSWQQYKFLELHTTTEFANRFAREDA